MDELRFEWDEAKDAINRSKHGLSFGEARTVFFDPHELVIGDPDHPAVEERFVILGYSRALRLLVVAHCHRESEGVIRIISARKATKHEARDYQAGGRHGR
ncbi:MAG: BrnT family toxin [Bifidobacteriaceae bacterium]|nr:BrnT family toxin [Bifidobacteriaceae bacterium]